MELPTVFEGLDYFTRRSIDSNFAVAQGKGKIVCWIPKQTCACGLLLYKPKRPNAKDYRVAAQRYVCDKGHSVGLVEYDKGKQAYVEYTCPLCETTGSCIISGEWKVNQKGDRLFSFTCDNCTRDIPVTNMLRTEEKDFKVCDEKKTQRECQKCKSNNIDVYDEENFHRVECFDCKHAEGDEEAKCDDY